MSHPCSRGSMPLHAALAACLAVPLAAPAQDRAAGRAVPTHVGAYFPLNQGTEWQWRVTDTDADGGTKTRTETARVWGEVPLRDGGSCVQVGHRFGNYISWNYWSLRDDGIFALDNAYTAGIRGVNAKRSTRFLAGPVGAETRWEWEHIQPVQTMAGAPQPDPESLKVRYRAELLAMDEEVTVPAGTFRAVHLRVHSDGRWGKGTRDVWLARGKGMVKETHGGQRVTRTKELTAFHPSSVAAVDRDAVAAAWAKGTAQGSTIEWLEPSSEAAYVRGGFVVARSAEGGARCGWFRRGEVQAMEPGDVAFWAERWREIWTDLPPIPEGVEAEHPAPENDHMSATFLVGAACRLQALREGCTEVKSAGSRTESTLGADARSECTVNYRGKDREGNAVQVQGRAVLAGGELRELKVEIQARDGGDR